MFFEPCLPTPCKRAPTGPDWVHEIKHDGYRLIVRRDGDRVRLYTRRGFEWSHRFPLIIAAVRSLKVRSAIIDGEAVVCGEDGRADFDRLHNQGYDDQVVLYAFDLIELDGDDWRPRPLEERKAKLARVLKRVHDGIYFNEHLDDDGELIFKHACRLGLEGIVSKRRDFPYRCGRTKGWIKVKNPDQLKAMAAIERCRTAALGGHVARCEKCSHTLIAYNSCRNRHCPKCQGTAAKEWLAEREAELLPVPYFHLVFTLPGRRLEVGAPRGVISARRGRRCVVRASSSIRIVMTKKRGRPTGTSGRAAVLSPSQVRHVFRVARARSRHAARAEAALAMSLGLGLRAKELISLLLRLPRRRA